jgi:acyl-homoserine-lactone acylase
MMKTQLQLLLLVLSVGLMGCSDSDSDRDTSPDDTITEPPVEEFSYDATLTRTEYGVPHIVAEDWGSLGYGHGYVFAEDNYCMLMEEIIRASGQSLEFFGEAGGSESTDFVFSLVNNNSDGQLEERYLSQQPQYILDLVAGYAAGYNRYLRETGVDNLPETDPDCRGADWVREINAVDLWKYFRRIQLQGSTDQGIVRAAILDAKGPGQAGASAMPAPVSAADLQRAFANADKGSNAIALGRDATQTGSGMLLGNPHQPWFGVGSWYQVHLTIPGEYDAMGAALKGFPKIAIGFNKDMAWTHTVSFASRFTLFELKLNPDDPLQYQVDGEFKDIVPEEVTIKVAMPDGSFEERTHTFYHWEYGLIVSLASTAGGIAPEFASLFDGWPTPQGTVYALRDANLENLRGIEMWVNVGKSSTVGEFADALKVIGNPLFHSLAADRNGDAFYGEISAIPNVTEKKMEECIVGINAVVRSLTNNAILALDGTRSDCQWGADADAPQDSGLFGFASLPSFFTTEYAANSNDSYWLSNPEQPLEGFPTTMGFIGHEGQQQNLRTQITHEMVGQRLEGTDGFDASPGFTLSSLQQLMYANRVFAADLTLDDVLTVCTETAWPEIFPPPGGKRACDVLSQWDRLANIDSRGTQVFTEFWKAISAGGAAFENAVTDQSLWFEDFDPTRALETPKGFNLSLEVNRERILSALTTAANALDAANVAFDAPWGEVQVLPRNGIDVPIHGGDGGMGVFGAISSGLSDGGYRTIGGGNSYIQTVTWDESDCPIADAIITTSQSINPESPYYSDQSELYSRKEWVRMPFCDDAIEANRITEPLQLRE